MQSAFVDIGLERDAFLYVSDFMELEDADEVDELPGSRPAPERYQPEPQAEARPVEAPAASTVQPSAQQDEQAESAENRPASTSGEARDNRGGWRGRRRRRGRRGERFPESKFSRPTDTPAQPPRSERPERHERHERAEYGPPPGYQPIILPGESISKYQRMSRPAPEPHRPAPAASEPGTPLAEIFSDDEPMFAAGPAELPGEIRAEVPEPAEAERAEEASADWDREQKRLHEMNVAAVFGAATEEDRAEEQEQDEREQVVVSAHPDQPAPAAGALAEEEIEEEEADLAHYVEELEEDAAFEELEEETHAAGEQHEATQEIAASADPALLESVPFSPDPLSSEAVDVAAEEEVDEEAEDEAELDEAQAEAEAALAAEAGGGAMTEARAEVRAPSGTAGYTQRAPRPAFDRRPQRGRRGGGRRFRRNDQHNLPLITDLLKEGQEILVQIAKEPIGKKGARITSHIALPGRFLVYMPTVNHTGVSRKIASEEERQRLKRIIQSERENGHGGFIVRTAAMNAAEDDLRADIRFLKGLWNEIKSRADSGKAPALIYHDLNVVERVLRDQVTSDFSAIWVDSDEEYERILRFANRFQPALVKRVKLYSKEVPLFEQFGLSEEINKALKSKVWLKSGGYIVINQTEALVAIDVNTGKYVGKTARLEDTIVKTNVDAIKEIVRQVRLRDLGGIIVIDFIDMDERRNRQRVMQALEEALRSDRAPSKVLQFNDFGLVAITRKRVKQSLERTIGSPCPYCQATGFVKSVTTVCNEIYLEMRKIAKHLEHADVMLRVNPEVAKALKAGNGRALTEMEELTKKTVIVKSDPALHQEQFDIN
jgi:ribonuclease G